jgi:hypothetical protein
MQGGRKERTEKNKGKRGRKAHMTQINRNKYALNY